MSKHSFKTINHYLLILKNQWVVVFILLKFLLSEFSSDREYRNISPRTLKSYLAVLDEFHDYCVGHELVNLEDVTQSIVKSYLIQCSKQRKNNPTTVNSKLHVLKIFCNYFENEMEIFNSKTNPTKRIPFAKEEIKIEVFSDAQIKQITNLADEQDYEKNLRDLEDDKAKIQKQYDIASLNTDASNKKRLLNLAQQLKDKTNAINDAKADHEIDVRKKALEDAKNAIDIETEAKKDQAQKLEDLQDQNYQALKSYYESERELTSQKYDDMINNDAKYAKIRQQILSGTFDQINKDLNDFDLCNRFMMNKLRCPCKCQFSF